MGIVRHTLALLTLSLASTIVGYAGPPAACGMFNAGLQTITDIPSPAGRSSYTGGLKVAVWYPTSTPASTYQYPSAGADLSGLVALNGPVATCARFLLIVF